MTGKAEHLELAALNEKEIDWEQVFETEFSRVYNFLRYQTADDALAEELAAETFARAWRSRNQYRADRAAFSTWLFTIARNLAIDHHRRHRPQIALQDVPEPLDERRPDEVVQQRHDATRLATLLADLPRREREIIALRYGADMPHRQIGRVLDLSAANVRVILFRTVRKLRAQWEK